MPNATPPSDSTSRLAERIGRALEQGDPLDAVLPDDALGNALRACRDATRETEVDAERSERMWAAIAAKTKPSPEATGTDDRRARILPMPSVRRWAVAAVLLVAVGLAWILLRTPGPEVVAQANTEVVSYTASDGSTVWLRPHSTLTRVPDDAALRYRLEGEAAFDVNARPDTSPFVVDAGAGRVRVLGTRFVVRTWTEQPEVLLQEGRVEWRHVDSGEAAVLAPGQQGRLTDDGSITVDDAPASQPLGWLEHELVLEQHSVRSVVAELEHHFAITIRVPPDVAQQTLSGRILLDDPASSLRDLGRVLGGRFERTEARTYRFEAQ